MNPGTLQTICQVLVCIGIIVTGLAGFGSHYYGKKNAAIENKKSTKHKPTQKSTSNQKEITPLLFSKVAVANFAANDELIIQMLLANKSSVDVRLIETDVYLINMLAFREQKVIDIVKKSQIDYETLLLPQLSETKYDFSITKDAFEKIKSGKLAILSKTTYDNFKGLKRILYVVTHYGKKRNTLATYKLWHEILEQP